MAVDRCYCHQVTFAALKELSARTGPDLDALSNATGCGTGCGLCIPYIRVMLKTGQTDLPVLSPTDIERALST